MVDGVCSSYLCNNARRPGVLQKEEIDRYICPRVHCRIGLNTAKKRQQENNSQRDDSI